MDPSIIWVVYTPQIIDGHGSVNYLGGLHLQNNSRTWIRQLFGGSTPPEKLTDMDPSIILGVYTSKIIDGHRSSIILGFYTPQIIGGHGSVNYLGGLHPHNN